MQDVYKHIVVPDMLQLENGIRIWDKNFVGTIHFIAGDHVELCDLAGITTGASYKNVCSLTRSVRIECKVRLEAHPRKSHGLPSLHR